MGGLGRERGRINPNAPAITCVVRQICATASISQVRGGKKKEKRNTPGFAVTAEPAEDRGASPVIVQTAVVHRRRVQIPTEMCQDQRAGLS